MANLDLYNKVRSVPSEAKKNIGGGRLKGMTDINPMWRIKRLTEEFGVCGIGWKYTIDKQWTERLGTMDNGEHEEIASFCNISLYVKVDGEWSDAIPGTGGSMFLAKEKNGMYMSDECFKMALTDAISVACKALGFGADVYWQNDKSKYTVPGEEPKIDKELRAKQDEVLQYCGDVNKLNDFCQGKWGLDFFECGKGQLESMLVKYRESA